MGQDYNPATTIDIPFQSNFCTLHLHPIELNAMSAIISR